MIMGALHKKARFFSRVSSCVFVFVSGTRA